jgi:hypothetical protein
VSREDIVSAFRTAMIGHFRSHIPGTNINESTLLASDYLNHFHKLVMLLEAISSEPRDFSEDLLSWRPLTYEEHSTESGSHDKNLAIAAYRRAPPKIRARFDEAVGAIAWRGRHGRGCRQSERQFRHPEPDLRASRPAA